LAQHHLDDEADWRRFSEQALRDIGASLVGNTHLKRLSIVYWHINFDMRDYEYRLDSIDNLLCDVSSIENIRSNSNQMLESISVRGQTLSISTLARQCLKLNSENENKAKVVRNKTLRFYFVGGFEVSPFVNMSLSVMAEVISQIEGDDKQSAVYRLLRCIPELCNVTYRGNFN
jgi:hypothetical protein